MDPMGMVLPRSLIAQHSPLKVGGWEMIWLPFGIVPIFRGELAVSFGEGKDSEF